MTELTTRTMGHVLVTGSLAALMSSAVPAGSLCEQWQSMDFGSQDAPFIRMAKHDGHVYVASTINVRRFTNGEWEVISAGGLFDFEDMISHDGHLTIAVGPGSQHVYRLVNPEESEWESLMPDTGVVQVYLRALGEYEGDLIVGGNFSEAEGVAANSIARWDGNDWHPLGEGVDGQVWALTVYNGELIAAGSFDAAGDQPASNIARWDGETWAPLGMGIAGGNVPVRSLEVHNGYLFAGGQFSFAGGSPANNIARWNGAEWAPVGSGVVASQVNPRIWTMTSYGQDLFVGGRFDSAGDVDDTANMAMWSTQPGSGTGTWTSIGSTSSSIGGSGGGIVRDSVVLGDGLLVGGDSINSFGGEPIEKLARWTAGVADVIEQPQSQQAQAGDDVVFTVVENPAQDAAPWTYEWRHNGIPITSASTPNATGYDTDTLTLQNVTLDDFGVYDVRVFNQCGMQISESAALSVQLEPTGSACPGDLNGDGVVDVFDLLELLDNWGSCEN